MAHFVEREWLAKRGGDSLPIRYRAYMPDTLVRRRFRFDPKLEQMLKRVERNLALLHADLSRRSDLADLNERAFRSEALASCRMDGFIISERHFDDETVNDRAVETTRGTIDALRDISTMPPAKVGCGDVLGLQHRIFGATDSTDFVNVRLRAKWIGGSPTDPTQANFVPPPPEQLPSLLEDLYSFCNETDLPPIAAVAIAHGQFETIHPFLSGNGRTGRALVHLILRSRGLWAGITVPFSLVLEARLRDYETALTHTRYEGHVTSAQAEAAFTPLVAAFAIAFRDAIDEIAYL